MREKTPVRAVKRALLKRIQRLKITVNVRLLLSYMSLSKGTILLQRFNNNNKQYFEEFCSKISNRNSVTDSENSQSSHHESPLNMSSNLDRKFTYWSIQRSMKKPIITKLKSKLKLS